VGQAFHPACSKKAPTAGWKACPTLKTTGRACPGLRSGGRRSLLIVWAGRPASRLQIPLYPPLEKGEVRGHTAVRPYPAFHGTFGVVESSAR